MNQMRLQEFHRRRGGNFVEVNGQSAVNDYGDWRAEHAALRDRAGVLDLGFRSRLCLIGADRLRFLHGQVTNDVSKLRAGEGIYAALTTAKGKMEGDANILCLAEELLLDLEPGLGEKIRQRLEKFIVADDVQVVDVAPHYGLLSVQGPLAPAVIRALDWPVDAAARPLASMKITDAAWGEVYLVNNARGGTTGYDLFVPGEFLAAAAERLVAATATVGGGLCGWQALETARIEAGIPRFGADMDETCLPLEAGLEPRAISYTKGCYIGQEVINRVHSIGHVNRQLCGLRFSSGALGMPRHGDKLFQAGKEMGFITSAVESPAVNAIIALGYVRREASLVGTELTVQTASGELPARVASLPFA